MADRYFLNDLILDYENDLNCDINGLDEIRADLNNKNKKEILKRVAEWCGSVVRNAESLKERMQDELGEMKDTK